MMEISIMMRVWHTAGLLGMFLVLSQHLPAQEKKQDKQEQKVKVSFQSVDLATVAKMVEKVTKKSFLYQEQLLRQKKITLHSETPLGPDELYRVLRAQGNLNSTYAPATWRL